MARKQLTDLFTLIEKANKARAEFLSAIAEKSAAKAAEDWAAFALAHNRGERAIWSSYDADMDVLRAELRDESEAQAMLDFLESRVVPDPKAEIPDQYGLMVRVVLRARSMVSAAA